jgi:hypothetical protein
MVPPSDIRSFPPDDMLRWVLSASSEEGIGIFCLSIRREINVDFLKFLFVLSDQN